MIRFRLIGAKLERKAELDPHRYCTVQYTMHATRNTSHVVARKPRDTGCFSTPVIAQAFDTGCFSTPVIAQALLT